MPDHENRSIADELLGCCDRLLRIAKVVCCDEANLLTEHAASGIDISNGHFRTTLQLLAGPGVCARHSPGDGNRDISTRNVAKRRRN